MHKLLIWLVWRYWNRKKIWQILLFKVFQRICRNSLVKYKDLIRIPYCSQLTIQRRRMDPKLQLLTTTTDMAKPRITMETILLPSSHCRMFLMGQFHLTCHLRKWELWRHIWLGSHRLYQRSATWRRRSCSRCMTEDSHRRNGLHQCQIFLRSSRHKRIQRRDAIRALRTMSKSLVLTMRVQFTTSVLKVQITNQGAQNMLAKANLNSTQVYPKKAWTSTSPLTNPWSNIANNLFNCHQKKFKWMTC